MNKTHFCKQSLFVLCFISLISLCSAAEITRLSSDNETYKNILNKTHAYYKAWSYTREDSVFDQAGVYYSKDSGRVYWDPLPPLAGYRGWAEYQDVITRIWKPNGLAAAGILFSHDDSFEAWRYQDVIWTTANCLVHAEYNEGNSETLACRGTQIWEKQELGWLLVHEHYSGTVNPAKDMHQGKRSEDPRIKTNTEFLKLAKQLASKWGAGKLSAAGKRLRKHYVTRGDLFLYMPWEPHDGYSSWSAFESGLKEYVSLTASEMNLIPQSDLEATEYGDLVLTTGTVEFQFKGRDGKSRLADGRQTLLWFKENDQWRVLHEHLSVPMSH